MGIPETIMDLLEPVVADFDAELVDVEWTGGTLRLSIATPESEHIDIDRLTRINRAISPVLDEHDPISGRYTLEVSSPGVERRLHRPEHYERAVGETIVVKLMAGQDPRRLKGKLIAATEESLTIDADDLDGAPCKPSEIHEILYVDVEKTRTHFDWGPQPKPHSTQRKKKSGHKKSGQKKSGPKQAGSKPKL